MELVIKLKLNLNTLEKEYALVRMMAQSTVPAELSSDRWVVNPRSLLGVASLDCTRPVTLTLFDQDERLVNGLLESGLVVIE